MISMDVESNVNAWEECIRRYGEDLHLAAREAMERVAATAVAIARRYVPVDTGHLQRSIVASVQDDPETVGFTLEAGTRYAGYVELGTHKMDARPYLAPAMAMIEDLVMGQLSDSFFKLWREYDP